VNAARRPALAGLSVFGLYSILAVALTWPLSTGIASDVPGDLGDSLLNMWILGWGAEHLPLLLTGQLGWSEFWNANIFHPDPLALALSEHLFGQTLQILPIYWLTGNIILCYNLLFISSFALSGLGAYLLVRDLTGDKRAAFIAGLIYGFLPYRIASVPHLQVMSSQWMPFALFGLNRFVSADTSLPRQSSRELWRAKSGALIGGTAALVMQNWSCGYYLLYFAPFVPMFLVHRMWTLGALRTRSTWVGLIAAAAGTLVLTLPFLWPYREAQQLFGFQRTLGEVYYFSANMWSYLTASENLLLFGKVLRANPQNEQEVFLGFVPVLLAAVALVAVVREGRAEAGPASVRRAIGWRIVTWLLIAAAIIQFLALMSVVLFGGFEINIAGLPIRARTPVRLTLQFLVAFGLLLAISRRTRVETVRAIRSPIAIFVAMTALAVLLSFGPNYGLYGALYEHVPGFDGVRVPARYAMIAGLFLAILGGFGAARILGANLIAPEQANHSSVRRRTVMAVIALLVLMEGVAIPIEINRAWAQNEAMPPARVYPQTQAPPVYLRLAALPAGTVVTEFPFGDAGWEIRYTYYAATHWKPITNGYSGNFPPRYKERVARLQRIAKDPEAAWASLKESGSTHVVVHRNAFANAADADTVENWLKAHGATEIERFSDGDILLSVN
jgi:hypothetical protein